MIAATLAQHLGLAEAIARVVDKVASCPQCFSFWVTMSALAIPCARACSIICL